MKQNLRIVILMTFVTTVLFGLLYPLAVTGLAQFFFPTQANGALIVKNGLIVGSHLIGQPFSSAGYFHSRPSAAGNGYDATSSWRFKSRPHESSTAGPRQI
jgi:potassium-transporting ATPase KdpC subunit